MPVECFIIQQLNVLSYNRIQQSLFLSNKHACDEHNTLSSFHYKEVTKWQKCISAFQHPIRHHHTTITHAIIVSNEKTGLNDIWHRKIGVKLTDSRSLSKLSPGCICSLIDHGSETICGWLIMFQLCIHTCSHMPNKDLKVEQIKRILIVNEVFR